ncbi:MAG TPA: pilus assembly protein TadE [Massilia sp.]|nr:pilus assembly protein TadE [Massilia sp.]
MGVVPGLQPRFIVGSEAVRPRVRAHAQGGLAMVEFVVVGPIIAVIGLGIIQYAQLFFAKSQINHASFMAARAGSVGHANLGTIKAEYTKALIPLYGGGTNPAELAESAGKAATAVGLSDVTILNPTRESFAAYNEPRLQARYNTNSLRVIPNARLAFKTPSVDSASGQTIQDANLLKLRIVHSYKPTIPLARTIFSAYLKAADPRNDAAYTRIVQDNGIPVVTHVTLHMQSDAIEGSPISSPGTGNGGNPTNPGDPPVSDTPSPPCTGIACNEEVPPDPVDPNAPCTGADCPVCPVV